MRRVFHLIERIAAKRHPVLVMGESGTGKELVARAIHNLGPNSAGRFVPVDCGAIAPTLIESELFGHVRGAFTGASQAREGLFAAARGGSIFLDEISELPLELQPKLLRALQEHEIRPVGSNERRQLDTRVIAASNQNLQAAVQRGTFRKDLYYRLNVFSIKLPPLRERKEEIPTLVRHFVSLYGGPENPFERISAEAMARLQEYDWPGNVRELENCIQRALTVGTPPEIQLADLPTNLLYPFGPNPGQLTLTPMREVERQAILKALEATGGHRLRAAKCLGIGKTTIYRKLKELGLEEFPASPSSRPE